MSKLTTDMENPIDNILMKGVELMSGPLHCMGATPNMVTTLSLAAGLGSAYALKKRRYDLAAALTALAYFLDCVDGYMARKYDQVTEFGDWYDHVSDIVKQLSLMFVMYKLDKRKFYRVLPVIMVFSISQCIHVGCQEKVYGKGESVTLSISKKLCPGNPNKNIKYTRYVGCGTLALVLVLCILYFKK